MQSDEQQIRDLVKTWMSATKSGDVPRRPWQLPRESAGFESPGESRGTLRAAPAHCLRR